MYAWKLRVLLGLVVTAFSLGACGDPGESAADSQFTGAGNLPGSPTEPSPQGLHFVEGPLTLEPGTRQLLNLRASPAGRYKIRCSLGPGSADASLDRAEVITDEWGLAELTVTAPTRTAGFSIHASTKTASTSLTVSVGSAGFGHLKVLPSYEGQRRVSTWTASAHVGATCAELLGAPPPDGPLLATASFGIAPVLTNVPVGAPLAVTLRAGHMAGGCQDYAGLTAQGTSSLVVTVLNRPVQLRLTQLPVRLSFAPSDGFDRWVDETVGGVELPQRPPLSDASALLERMSQRAPSPEDFTRERQAQAWDEALGRALGGAPHPVRQWWGQALRAGARRLLAADAVQAELSSAPGQASRLALVSVAGVAADDAALAVNDATTAVSCDAADTLLLSASSEVHPLLLLSQLALLSLNEPVSTPAGSLAAAASAAFCETTAATLAASGSAALSCERQCLQDLCALALDELWQEVQQGDAPAQFTLSASGVAQVDEEARPISFEGAWRGLLTRPQGDALTLSGPLSGGAKSVP